ncbi:hypothetical protein TNCV_4808221 [Trichonephila clavipes]|nr:hypothetical protein TNCV_4808221 [Trichonephila clavipes]
MCQRNKSLIPRIAEKRLNKKDRYLKSFSPQGEAGGRERPNEDETGVTSRGREGKSAGREGLTAPKRVRGAPKTQWEGECCFFLTKLEPALTLIPVLMRGKCV